MQVMSSPVLLSLARSDDAKTRETCASTLCVLSSNKQACPKMVKAGTVEILIELLTRDPAPSKLKLKVIEADRSCPSTGPRSGLSHPSVVMLLSSSVFLYCAHILYELSGDPAYSDPLVKAGVIESVLSAATRAMREKHEELQHPLIGTVCNLAVEDQNRSLIASAGGVQVLLDALSSSAESGDDVVEYIRQRPCQRSQCAHQIALDRKGFLTIIMLAQGGVLKGQGLEAMVSASKQTGRREFGAVQFAPCRSMRAASKSRRGLQGVALIIAAGG